MKTRLLTSFFTAVLLSATAHATPMIMTLDSDAAFNELDFDKVVGANVRWGNGMNNGDWEYSVVDANDNPQDARQFEWSTTGNNLHGFEFQHRPDQGIFRAGIFQGTPNNRDYLSEGTVAAGNPNALFFRVRSNAANGLFASLSNIGIAFFDDNFVLQDVVSLGDLLGTAGDVGYLGLVDDRLSGIFAVTALGSFTAPGGGRGSLPAYQAKLGILDGTPSTEIPLPGTLALFGAALFGVGLRRRR